MKSLFLSLMLATTVLGQQNEQLSRLPDASLPLTANDWFYVVQRGIANPSRRITLSDLSTQLSIEAGAGVSLAAGRNLTAVTNGLLVTIHNDLTNFPIASITNANNLTNWALLSTNVIGSGSGTPGGSSTQVQFNDSGSFGGDAGLTYDKTTDKLTLAGDLAIGTGPKFQVVASDGSGYAAGGAFAWNGGGSIYSTLWYIDGFDGSATFGAPLVYASNFFQVVATSSIPALEITINGMGYFGSNVVVKGDLITQQRLIGNGIGVTNLQADNIAAGTLSDARLSGNVSLLGSSITEGEFSFSDVTTANASASAHGLLPKLSGSASDVLKGDGSWGSALVTNTIFSLNIDGAGATISTGLKGGNPAAAASYTICGWAISAQGNNPTATFDVWKIAQGASLPTVANTIMGTKPALTSGNATNSTTLTSWTTTVTKGDIWGCNLDATTGATNITLQIFGYR